MSANEKAEAFLIVVKRLMKWAAFALLAVAALVAALLGYEEYENYLRDKPRLLTEYAGVSLGDSAQQVRYALGQPAGFLSPSPEKADEQWAEFPAVGQSKEAETARKIELSKTWLYPRASESRVTVDFDKAGGAVTSISCFSTSVYTCPGVFGIQDGTQEEEVLERLGKPDEERLFGLTKTLQFNRYNLKLYLEKKAVYVIEVTAPGQTGSR